MPRLASSLSGIGVCILLLDGAYPLTPFLLVLGWTFQGLTIRNCNIGFEMQSGGLTLETQVILSLIDLTIISY